ncbi:hypothetical protein COE51_15230 [Bacillus pseudomycoides]|nr:hypothetical protein COE51_15230 [Bacillus pseudomycoides]
MKKKLIVILSIICIITGGYFTMEYLKQKEIKEQFWKRQEARITKYIHYNIKDVKSITFTEHNVNPMGVPSIKGYINDNKELSFNASIIDSKDYEKDFSCSGQLYDNYVKKPEKSVSEIEEEEKEKKQE